MTAQSTMHHPRVVSRDEWIPARLALLAQEKEHTHRTDQLSRQRRELPWVRVEKPYLFQGARGTETLADLFAGRSELLAYHFRFGPDMEEGCASCSLVPDRCD